MAIINLKGVRNHRRCPKNRANPHRCYDQVLAESIADTRNDESVFEIYGAFRCTDKRCQKYSCWHVGHVKDYTTPRAVLEALENEVLGELQYGRLQVSGRPK